MAVDFAGAANTSKEGADATALAAMQFLQSILNIARTPLSYPDIPVASHAFYDALSNNIGTLQGVAPTAPNIDIPSATAPIAPTLVTPNTALVSNIVVPELTAAVPVLNIPASPALVLPDAPTNAPTINMPAIPDAPTITLPAVPALTDIVLPNAPAVTIPDFIAASPVNDLTAPTNTFAWAEQAYASALGDTLQARIIEDLESGTFGLRVEDEAPIWERARERDVTTALANIAEAERDIATRGYVLPPGQLSKITTSIRQTVQDASTGTSREIAIKRVDQYNSQRNYMVQYGIQFEQMMIGFHAGKQERALNAQKATADVAIAFYNTQVQAFQARLEAYKTEAEVFRTRLSAEVEKLNVYRAQLEAARTKGDLDRTRVESYRAQLAGLETVVGIYKARMDAASTQAGIERIKLDAFRSQIDAFQAQVQGNTAKFQAYEAAIKGEEAKQRVYEEQVRGYTAQLEGVRAKAQLATTTLEAQMHANRGSIDIYTAQTQQFRTTLDAAMGKARITSTVFSNQVQAYDARSRTVTNLAGLGVQNYAANSADFHKVLDYNMSRAKLELDKLVKQIELQKSGAKEGLTFYANQVQSLLSQINAIGVETA